MVKRVSFETSRELKQLYNEQMDLWRKRERAGLEELARRCGVSPAYLAHVGRYGRIPSRPVLVLLALNFDMQDPGRLLAAAGVKEQWPYDEPVALSPRSATDTGFLSLRMDMTGFTAAIREIVRGEIRPRTISDLLRGRPLRVGLNPLKHWFFEEDALRPPVTLPPGFFTEFCSMLGLSLQCRVEFSVIEYGDYSEFLQQQRVDIFGPCVTAPNLPSNTVFTSPLYQIGMSALMRKVPTTDLPTLPVPRTAKEMIEGPYQIAVIRNSRAHLLANTRFKRPDSQLVICHSHEEALDRITLRGVVRPAHLFVCNSVDARLWHEDHKTQTVPIFETPETLLDVADTGIAVRADWPELVAAINEFIAFVDRSGTLGELFYRWAPKQTEGLLQPMTHAREPQRGAPVAKRRAPASKRARAGRS